jgi:hypothetical protein
MHKMIEREGVGAPAIVAPAQENALVGRGGYRLLHWTLAATLVILGIDRFFRLLVDWDKYVAPVIRRPLGANVHTLVMAIGVLELVAGVLVVLRPRLGAYFGAALLLLNVISFVLIPGYFDVAVRDLVLALVLVALAQLTPRFLSR